MSLRPSPQISNAAPLHVRVLGCAGAIARGERTTSFLVNRHLLVDAGTGVGDLTWDEMADIQHVVLTHSHLDHIAALPLMLDAVGTRRNRPLQVHALPATLQALQTHVFNDVIWPDFSRLPSVAAPLVTFHPLQVGEPRELAGVWAEALPALHTVPAVGYALSTNPAGPHWVFSGDTGHHPAFWQRVNQLPVGVLVVETAFSEREAGLAQVSRHLCPSTLMVHLESMRLPVSCPVFITHTKPAEAERIMNEIHQLHAQRQAAGLAPWTVSALKRRQVWTL